MGRNRKSIYGHLNWCVCVPSGDSLLENRYLLSHGVERTLRFYQSQMMAVVIGSQKQKRSPPFFGASWVWLVSISFCSLLKPAYAGNKIRAWGDSLATWSKKRWLFICAADRPDQGKGSSAESGCEVKGHQMPFSQRTGGPMTLQRAPALIAGAENTRKHKRADIYPCKHFATGTQPPTQLMARNGRFFCANSPFMSSSIMAFSPTYTPFSSISGLIHPNESMLCWTVAELKA